MAKALRLTVELVPKTSWFDNLRSVLPRSVWDKRRKRTYAEYGYRCGICGAEGRLNCHEIWEYDDENHIQRLSGFVSLCDLCHHVKHIGLAGILASEGKLDYESVVNHYMKVNGCDRKTFERHVDQAFAQWEDRSKHEWSVDLGEYQDMVGEHKKTSKERHSVSLNKDARVQSIYDELTRRLEEKYGKLDPAIVERIRQLYESGNIMDTDDVWTNIYICEKCGYKWTHTHRGNETILDPLNHCPRCSVDRRSLKEDASLESGFTTPSKTS